MDRVVYSVKRVLPHCTVSGEYGPDVADFNDLMFEDRTLGEIIGAQGWGAHLSRTGTTSMDRVREFYIALLLVPNISDDACEVTVHNTTMLFSQGELLSKEEKPTPAELFWMMLGPGTVVLEGNNMNHEALSYELSGLPHSLLLTQFLQAMLIPEGLDKAKGRPLQAIIKTTLSHSMAQTH
ncbi:hypothetical protein CJ030_MR0G004586 [Morella rubra]|uniref:Uncharacterized protein n=1 Tax=Morella rubra TaxID=262757 RepID=A0A6A1UMV3_9ROSI|nr:hypothetical protein CJ030_MR0G004586 [Morella rubra]